MPFMYKERENIPARDSPS